MIENQKAKMKKEIAVAADVYDASAEVCAGLSPGDMEIVLDRIDSASFGECQCCGESPCRGVLVASKVDNTNGLGTFTVFGLCKNCREDQIDVIASCLSETGFKQPAMYWSEKRPVH
ncbi:MAG: hypothetical protein ACLQVJ_03345 [Syntrophobacteraceae bacterium]